MTSSPGANLFGGKRFWAFAIGISVIFGVGNFINAESKKADAAAEDARARNLATRTSAIVACERWMRKLYGEDDPAFAVVQTRVLRADTFDYAMDVTFDSTSVLNKKVFTRTEGCNVVWDFSDDRFTPRAR